VVLPEGVPLRAEDVDADVIGGGVIGDGRQQFDRQAGLAHTFSDPLAPAGVDLAREVDVPGAVVGHGFR
jgi:hypothetical protein